MEVEKKKEEAIPESRYEETKAEEDVRAVVEDDDEGSKIVKVLVDEGDVSLVSEEVEGVAQGGNANIGKEDEEMCVKNIVTSESRDMLAEANEADSTLATARAFADQMTEGYHWTEGLLFRTRLDILVDSIKQLKIVLAFALTP